MMLSQASNDILIDKLTCRCIKSFSVKRYIKKKTCVFNIEEGEVINYELRGTKLTKEGLYSVIKIGKDKIAIQGNLSELPNFTINVKD